MTDLTGIPIIYNNAIPKGMAYVINDRMIVWGTWWKKPTVASVIATQRRRRR